VEGGAGGFSVACEFALSAAATTGAAAASGGCDDCAATHVSTPARVVSSALATCEAPEARSNGVAPVGISLAGASSAASATFAFIGSPDPVASGPASGPSSGGSVITVLGGGVGGSTSMGMVNVSSAAKEAAADGMSAGAEAGAACGFGSVGPVAGRILASAVGGTGSGRAVQVDPITPKNRLEQSA